MTEAEWQTSEDPAAMLTTLENLHTPGSPLRWGPRMAVSSRKLQLFAVACCYGLGRDLGAEAERCVESGPGAARRAADWAMAWCGDQRRPSPRERAALLRDVAGNPFRPLRLLRAPMRPDDARRQNATVRCTCDCAGRCPLGKMGMETRCTREKLRAAGVMEAAAWLTPDALRVARDAYEDRRPDGTLDPVTLSVLADALADGGCDSADLLGHLRDASAPHVRGCFAIDLVLGLE